MNSYLNNFLEQNKNKPFFTNLQKYNSLNRYGKLKCISSFLTNLFIDAEKDLDIDDQNENIRFQKELLLILHNIMLFNNDDFSNWFYKNLGE